MKSRVRCVQEGNLAAVLLMMKLHFKSLLVSQGGKYIPSLCLFVELPASSPNL